MSNLLDSSDLVDSDKKTQEIRIIINQPKERVFEYVLEPKNTPNWCKSIESESIDTEQIGMGTIYTNNFGKLKVTDYERNVYFELSELGTEYQCSYSFHKIDDGSMELVYFEGMLEGSDLDEPMEKESFERLKEILEKD